MILQLYSRQIMSGLVTIRVWTKEESSQCVSAQYAGQSNTKKPLCIEKARSRARIFFCERVDNKVKGDKLIIHKSIKRL